jgi:hypothetical protein
MKAAPSGDTNCTELRIGANPSSARLIAKTVKCTEETEQAKAFAGQGIPSLFDIFSVSAKEVVAQQIANWSPRIASLTTVHSQATWDFSRRSCSLCLVLFRKATEAWPPATARRRLLTLSDPCGSAHLSGNLGRYKCLCRSGALDMWTTSVVHKLIQGFSVFAFLNTVVTLFNSARIRAEQPTERAA